MYRHRKLSDILLNVKKAYYLKIIYVFLCLRVHLEVCIPNIISDSGGPPGDFYFLLLILLFCFFFRILAKSIYYSYKKNVLKIQERKRGILNKWQSVV